MTTVFLHGFWGQPSDWSAVLQKLPLNHQVWTPDLYEPGPLAPHHTIEDWCDHFFAEIDDRFGPEKIQVVGYSMGGRLLVNLVAERPERFSRSLVLSGNPFPVERSMWEKKWRQNFLELPWDELEHVWEEQGVFEGSQYPQRRRSSLLREMLGQSLIHWSPSQHVYLAGEIQSLPSTVDWAFGALDQKYVDLSKDLATLPVQGQISVIENAGHRLPLDSAPWIVKWVEGPHKGITCKTSSN